MFIRESLITQLCSTKLFKAIITLTKPLYAVKSLNGTSYLIFKS